MGIVSAGADNFKQLHTGFYLGCVVSHSGGTSGNFIRCFGFGAFGGQGGKKSGILRRRCGKQSDVKFDTDCPLFKGCPEIAPPMLLVKIWLCLGILQILFRAPSPPQFRLRFSQIPYRSFYRQGTCTGGRIMILLIDSYDSFSYNLYQLISSTVILSLRMTLISGAISPTN